MDQHFAEEHVDFLRISFQKREIIIDLIQPVHHHPPLNAAADGCFSIQTEIDLRLCTKQCEDGF